MALSLTKRGKIWQVVGTLNGQRVRESTRTQDRTEAERIRAEMEYEFTTGLRKHGEKRKDNTRLFKAVADMYIKSRRTGNGTTTQRNVLNLVDYFGDVPIQQIDNLAIEMYIHETHMAKGNSNNTIRRDLAQLQAVLNFGAELGLRPTIKIAKPPEDQERTRIMSESEQEAIWERFSPQMNAVCTFILNTGARPSEALKLTHRDVDTTSSEPHVFLWSKKGRSSKLTKRYIPLNQDAINAIRLANQLNSTHGQDDYVFTMPNGERWTSHWELNKHWARVVKEQLSIADLNPYDLRHTFATRLARGGAPIKVIADLLGHADLRMVTRYVNTDSQDLRSAVSVLSTPQTTNDHVHVVRHNPVTNLRILDEEKMRSSRLQHSRSCERSVQKTLHNTA